MIFDTAKYTNPGGREINEDSLLCRNGVWVVADGLGGHADGEKASAEAIRYLDDNCCGGYTDQMVSELLEGANSAVCALNSPGRSTVAAAFAENGVFRMANAGDSRVYYFRDGKIIAQTKDHSVCQASVDMGMISPDDIRGSEDRSSLLKVLGNESSLNIKKPYPAINIKSGDGFLVCSDGFWEYVLEAEMEADLLKSDSAEAWLSHMLKRHLLRAGNHGDNYTVICGFIYKEGSDTGTVHNKRLRPAVIISAAVVALLAAAVGLFALRSPEKDDTADNTTETESFTETLSDTSLSTEDTLAESDTKSETEEAVPADADIADATVESDETTDEVSEIYTNTEALEESAEVTTSPVTSETKEDTTTTAPETTTTVKTTTTVPETTTTVKTTTTAPETTTTVKTTTTAPETTTTVKTTTTAPETTTTAKTTTTAPETTTTVKTTTTAPETTTTAPEITAAPSEEEP